MIFQYNQNIYKLTSKIENNKTPVLSNLNINDIVSIEKLSCNYVPNKNDQLLIMAFVSKSSNNKLHLKPITLDVGLRNATYLYNTTNSFYIYDQANFTLLNKNHNIFITNNSVIYVLYTTDAYKDYLKIPFMLVDDLRQIVDFYYSGVVIRKYKYKMFDSVKHILSITDK